MADERIDQSNQEAVPTGTGAGSYVERGTEVILDAVQDMIRRAKNAVLGPGFHEAPTEILEDDKVSSMDLEVESGCDSSGAVSGPSSGGLTPATVEEIPTDGEEVVELPVFVSSDGSDGTPPAPHQAGAHLVRDEYAKKKNLFRFGRGETDASEHDKKDYPVGQSRREVHARMRLMIEMLEHNYGSEAVERVGVIRLQEYVDPITFYIHDDDPIFADMPVIFEIKKKLVSGGLSNEEVDYTGVVETFQYEFVAGYVGKLFNDVIERIDNIVTAYKRDGIAYVATDFGYVTHEFLRDLEHVCKRIVSDSELQDDIVFIQENYQSVGRETEASKRLREELLDIEASPEKLEAVEFVEKVKAQVDAYEEFESRLNLKSMTPDDARALGIRQMLLLKLVIGHMNKHIAGPIMKLFNEIELEEGGTGRAIDYYREQEPVVVLDYCLKSFVQLLRIQKTLKQLRGLIIGPDSLRRIV
ncbi:hypothetical protein KKC94_02180 [Patescibacteria group bacterium]|nr:hypothetical protein [Patescibacteria group bacterium]